MSRRGSGECDEISSNYDQKWMESCPSRFSLRKALLAMWLLPRQALLSRERGWRWRKAASASTERSVRRLLVTMRVSTSGIWASRCSSWSMSASTSEQPIIRTVFTPPNSRRERRQQPKLVLEASPPISSTMCSVRAVLLRSSSTDSTRFLLPSDLRQTFHCLLTPRGMQLSKGRRCSSSRATSARSCSPKREAAPPASASADFSIDRERRDLLKPCARLGVSSLQLLLLLSNLELLLLARARLLDVPQILDLSSLETLEQLLDWMFSLSSHRIGDFLVDFTSSLPSAPTPSLPSLLSAPTSRPCSATILLTSYLCSFYIISFTSDVRLLLSSELVVKTSLQFSSILRMVSCRFSFTFSISRIRTAILSSQQREILALRSSAALCSSVLAVGRWSPRGLGGRAMPVSRRKRRQSWKECGWRREQEKLCRHFGQALRAQRCSPAKCSEHLKQLVQKLHFSWSDSVSQILFMPFSQDYYYIIGCVMCSRSPFPTIKFQMMNILPVGQALRT